MSEPDHPREPSTVHLDATSLRGLAHPLRVRLLGLLREHGPSTATGLSRRVGQSSGVTSYHLRQLEAYGFIEEDTSRGNRRERWWRARHRMTEFQHDEDAGPEARLLGDEYLRGVGRGYAERLGHFLDGLETVEEDLGRDWASAWTIGDYALALTPESAKELIAEIEALLERFPRAVPGAQADGLERVVVQYQVLPQAYAAPIEETTP